MKHFNLPDLGEGLHEAQILKWHVQVGDSLEIDQLLVSVETAKAVVDIPAPYAGLVAKTYGEPGDILAVGTPLLSYAMAADAGTVVGRLDTHECSDSDDFFIGASPSTRAFGITAGATVLQGVSRSMVLSMERSAASVVPVSIFADADLYCWRESRDPLMRLIKAVATACRLHPALNCWFERQSLSVKSHGQVDLGIAVNTDQGLFVPVLRGVGSRPTAELKRQLAQLRREARARTLKPADLQGATITLSNFGALSCRYATPIVMPPQVAIIGAGGIREEPVAMSGVVHVHPVLPLSLTFDHRAVTGKQATDFLQALVLALENPDE